MAAFSSPFNVPAGPSSFERDIQFNGFFGSSTFGQQQQQQSRNAFEVRQRQQAAMNEIELMRRMASASPEINFEGVGNMNIPIKVTNASDTPWQAFCRELRAEMAEWLDLELN